MKIMFSQEAMKDSFIYSIAKTLQAIDGEIILWPHQMSAFDALDIYKPNILFITNIDLTKNTLLPLTQYQDVKVILYSVTLPKHMINNCNPVMVIVPPGTQPHVIKNIDHENIFEATYAADLINYSNGYYLDKAASDILVIVDATVIFNHSILQQINDILAFQGPNISVKCIGHRVNTPLYVGQMSSQHTSCFMQSTKLIVSYSFDMIPNCVINKTLCITPHKQNWMPQFLDSNGLSEAIQQFLPDSKQKHILVKKAQQQILSTDTYFHRLSDLGTALQISEWSTKALTTLPRYIK